MLITLVIEIGQLGVGVGLAIDSGDHFNIQANTSITSAFILVLTLAFIIMKNMVKNIKS